MIDTALLHQIARMVVTFEWDTIGGGVTFRCQNTVNGFRNGPFLRSESFALVALSDAWTASAVQVRLDQSQVHHVIISGTKTPRAVIRGVIAWLLADRETAPID